MTENSKNVAIEGTFLFNRVKTDADKTKLGLFFFFLSVKNELTRLSKFEKEGKRKKSV